METNFLPGLMLAFRKSRRETVQINQGVITFRRIPCSAKGCLPGFSSSAGPGQLGVSLQSWKGLWVRGALGGSWSFQPLSPGVMVASDWGWTQASLKAFLSKQTQLTLSCGLDFSHRPSLVHVSTWPLVSRHPVYPLSPLPSAGPGTGAT